VIELSLAKQGDVRAMRALIHRSVRELGAGLYARDVIEAALAHVFGVDSQLIDDRTYYVVSDGREPVAIGGWSARRTLFGGDHWKRGPDDLLDPAIEPARIRAFFVHPDWTRRGFARRIYAECERAARARGFRRFELAATLPGVPLYRALGFAEREPIPVPLPRGLVLTCIRMDRAID
jgi:GNAT superfamily N-acetyltransferase